MHQVDTRGMCPIASIPVNEACSITRCTNNREGTCTFQTMVNLEGQLDATAEYFGVSVQDVENRVKVIHSAIVAAAWFEHINQRTLINGTASQFDAATDPQQAHEFKFWNSSNFNFGQVVSALILIRQRL